MCKSGVMTRVGNMAQKAGLVPQGKKWTPTKEWLNGFLDRHPDVTVTDAKPTSASSQGPHLHEALKCMFTDYRRVLDFLGLTHSNQGNCVWNMDETGERLDPREPVEVRAGDRPVRIPTCHACATCAVWRTETPPWAQRLGSMDQHRLSASCKHR